jgi:transcriptional regulator of arginine metabolism
MQFNMRKHRLKEIQRIISQDNIGSQEIILSKLIKIGINITQATLSRDLAYLKVGKFFIANKGFIYVLPQDIKKIEAKHYQSNDNFNGVLSMNFSRNIAVVHTLSGFANQICVIIDDAKLTECNGTIAGDDTIMIVIDENISQEQFKKVLLDTFPSLKDKI